MSLLRESSSRVFFVSLSRVSALIESTETLSPRSQLLRTLSSLCASFCGRSAFLLSLRHQPTNPPTHQPRKQESNNNHAANDRTETEKVRPEDLLLSSCVCIFTTVGPVRAAASRCQQLCAPSHSPRTQRAAAGARPRSAASSSSRCRAESSTTAAAASFSSSSFS